MLMLMLMLMFKLMLMLMSRWATLWWRRASTSWPPRSARTNWKLLDNRAPWISREFQNTTHSVCWKHNPQNSYHWFNCKLKGGVSMRPLHDLAWKIWRQASVSIFCNRFISYFASHSVSFLFVSFLCFATRSRHCSYSTQRSPPQKNVRLESQTMTDTRVSAAQRWG